MDSLTRLGPYVWPYRRLMAWSVVFALLVAALWGANLSCAFPIVKVLLEGQGLHEYVDAEIVRCERQITKDSKRLNDLERAIQSGAQPDNDLDDTEIGLPVLVKKTRLQARLTDTSHQLLGFRKVKTSVLPFIPHDRFNTFALLLATLLVATLIKDFFFYLQDLMVGRVVQLITMDLRKALFRQTLKLDYQSVSAAGTSDLLSRFTYDVDTLANGLMLLGGKVVREPLKAVACVVLAFWVNWQLTLLSLVFVPIAGVVFHRFGQLLKRASHKSAESMSRIYKLLEESLESIKVIIAFNGARHHRQRFHVENKAFFEKSMHIVKIDSLTGPVTEVMGLFALVIAMLPGVYLVLRNTDSIWGIKLASRPMGVAELGMLYALMAGISDPVRKLSSVFAKVKKSMAAADRVFDLMDRQSLIKEPVHPQPLPRHSQGIEFRKVSFTYYSGADVARPCVLEKISLKIRAGEVIAVVGENGSGKSTLVNLLPRYFDPEHGSVLIDGVDIRNVRLRDLRNQLGVVTQETLLFDDTIYNNIRYGRPNASPEEIRTAADQAHVTQFLDQFPEGFETRVGEKGSRLSGGQRQRIALARAMLRDPTILILDEATSAIDAQSEFLIHKALATFTKDRTTFIITHSVSQSILDLVTRIVVMEQGQLVAIG
ncbi:MAG: Xenobiotic-transporting ATPase, partial [Planctomycetaceae bacterium]|nr:Xenobiotic-transporting ATPase [Planctomycetaceae bacterium]